jgi:hypothetical protein
MHIRNVGQKALLDLPGYNRHPDVSAPADSGEIGGIIYTHYTFDYLL